MQNHGQWLLVTGLLAYLVFAWMPGCHKYGDVSLGTYEHAQALYSICNRRDSERLKTFVDSLDKARARNEITERERKWLLDIVATAESGDWEAAAANAGRMMREQVGR
ncbi:MAG: hypothetical protein KDA90_00865 [Planctomycetaceae bacterium]|nr:hypothetical protein [Planctomycetaceae bacterium]